MDLIIPFSLPSTIGFWFSVLAFVLPAPFLVNSQCQP